MHRLVEFMEHYLLRSLIPFVIVLGVSLGVLLTALYAVAIVEANAERPTPFEMELPALGHAPLWIVLVAGLMIVNGIVASRAELASARLGRRLDHLYEVSIPFPLGRLAAVNIVYVGGAIMVFYAMRQLLTIPY